MGPTACFVFFLLGTAVNKMVMSPVVARVVNIERREGDFRYKHMQVDGSAEFWLRLSNRFPELSQSS